MKPTLLLLFTLLLSNFGLHAQADTSETLEIPASEFAVYQYDPVLDTKILTYQYADLWDLDNDGTMDSVAFIGNGGAHTYFHFQLKLSSESEWRDYPTFYVDMPYLTKTIQEMTQFAVLDIDKDGVSEIYLNIDNPFGSIPQEMKQLNSKRLIFDFENNQLIIHDFEG